jgi:hypothetical protein
MNNGPWWLGRVMYCARCDHHFRVMIDDAEVEHQDARRDAYVVVLCPRCDVALALYR